MKAPDKLYCGIQELDTGYVYALSLDNNGEQEYIRKDALLEWAKEQKEDEMANFPYVLDMLIDKLNSM